MASRPITSRQIEGEKVGVVTDFLFLGSKLTVDSDCSHEIKRHLLLGRKAVTNLHNIFSTLGVPRGTAQDPVAVVVHFPLGTNLCAGRRAGILAGIKAFPCLAAEGFSPVASGHSPFLLDFY